MLINKIKNFINSPISYLVEYFDPIVLAFYRGIVIPVLKRRIYHKEKIKVVFVISELGCWKTENLYRKMLSNPRFNVVLLLVQDYSSPYANSILKSYLDDKKYYYYEIRQGEKIHRVFKPDIIFYQKPYNAIIDNTLFYHYNLASLFCFVSYTFWNRCSPKINNVGFLKYVWQIYVENESVYKDLEPIMCNHANNMVISGVPFMDILLKDKSHFDDPWVSNNKKRIIYAPHHTISSEIYKSQSPYDYSTFLTYADTLLELADKYKNETQWAFKPHPLLRVKLNKIWGTARTDTYYNKWNELENAQIVEGEYMGLFKHSDAMIHDCGSFKIEYLYTGNPVMYLFNENQEYDYPNTQTKKALELHYKAFNDGDIETFITNVINGIDTLKESRSTYRRQYQTPPFNKSACDNIINAILGKEEFGVL